MIKNLATILMLFCCITLQAQNDSTRVELNEVTISSFLQRTSNVGGNISYEEIQRGNYGQEPSNLFDKMPSIISLNDNGTEFGYGYYRIRGLDQTRINVSIDGCNWNEAEDYGSYFANSPDLLSSMNAVKVERGASSLYNGIAGVGGGIILESVNLYDNKPSYLYISGGSFGSIKATGVYNMKSNKGFGLHVKATHQQTEGFRDYGFNKSQAGTIKFGYRFGNHSIDFLSMNGYHRNGQGWIGNTKEELSLNKHANGCTDRETDNWFMTMNRVQYKGWITDNTLITSSIYYQFQDGSYRFDLDNYMTRMVDKNWNATNILYDYGLRHNMIGANVMAKQYINDFVFTLGVNGYKFQRKHFLDDKGINVPQEEYYNNKGVKNDITTFSLVEYGFKNVTLRGNIQYRHVGFSYKDYVNNVYSFDEKEMNTMWDFVNFGFNIDYKPVNNVKIYTSFNYVSREPTRSDMFGGNEKFVGELATIKAEKAKDVELGAEYMLRDKLYLGANLFYMLFDNELVLNGKYGLNGLPCHDNADKSYRTGVELSAKWNVFSKLNINANTAISKNKVTTNTFGRKNHILSPNKTANMDIAWDDRIWSIGVNAHYHDAMYIDMANEHTIPYTFTLNLYGRYTYKNAELGVRFNNVTNRVNYSTGAVGVDNQTLYFRNAPFNFNVSLKYVF